ncbi:DUF397 domain-containing protein [Streptomyces sp. NPDC089424]|uniref:DUF397 domain-containing protein n=1 Tax=Streptomyces sp. NPDC089424 TaxID=3365917 RepID=UPI00382A8C3C
MSVAEQSGSELVWFKSSYSGGNATECVEAAFASPGVLIRDSKRLGYRHIAVSATAWALFVAGTRQVEGV